MRGAGKSTNLGVEARLVRVIIVEHSLRAPRHLEEIAGPNARVERVPGITVDGPGSHDPAVGLCLLIDGLEIRLIETEPGQGRGSRTLFKYRCKGRRVSGPRHRQDRWLI